LRWLLGMTLLLGAIYGAVWSLIDPDWALPSVIGVAALLVAFWLLVGLRRLGRRRTLGRLISGTPTEFEETVADLLREQGFRGVRRTGGAGDLTADIVARDRAGRLVVVQCKRYAPGKPIGSKDLQTFIGMQRVHHEADYGLYVTTSTYTAPARALADRHGITLVDGADLTEVLGGGRRVSWMRR
jgi:restriction system protein